MTCMKCNGRGYTMDDAGKMHLCDCSRREDRKAYLAPLKAYLSPYAPSAPMMDLRDGPQAIIKKDSAVKGLMKLMSKTWYPEPYEIVTMELCNEVGFQRHGEYRSIRELAGSRGAFVLDLSFVNKVRARVEGIKEYDTMYVLDFLHEVVFSRQGKIVIVLDPRIKTFMTSYPELCDGFAEFGIEYFDGMGYKPFSRLEGEEGRQGGDWI